MNYAVNTIFTIMFLVFNNFNYNTLILKLLKYPCIFRHQSHA